MMFGTVITLWLLSCLPPAYLVEPDEHREFQYNSVVDGRGQYNFAYDTGHDPLNAHSLHMQYRDADGVVRGRYGYTDPRGNLRIVEYEAGPDGFKARGDVGPDLHPHSEAPGLAKEKPESVPMPLRLSEWDPVPVQADGPVQTPLRMSGWDPVRNPIDRRVENDGGSANVYPPDQWGYYPETATDGGTDPQAENNQPGNDGPYPQNADQPEYYPEILSPESESYEDYYKRFSSRNASGGNDVEVLRDQSISGANKAEPLLQYEPLTVHNIDVNPDEIRMAAPLTNGVVTTSRRLSSYQEAEHRTGSSDQTRRKYLRTQAHDHVSEDIQGTKNIRIHTHDHSSEGRPVTKIIRTQTHDHASEGRPVTKIVRTQTHDHESEGRPVTRIIRTQTHDHESEGRPVTRIIRTQTHDHASEGRPVTKITRTRTHDHASEGRPITKITRTQTHDHASEGRSNKYYVGSHSHDRSEPIRYYYRDDHDTRPHEHTARFHDHTSRPLRVYNNDAYHRHTDGHLYGDGKRSRYYYYRSKPHLIRQGPGESYQPQLYYWD